MTSIHQITLEADDPAAARDFYAAAFGLGEQVAVRPASAPTSGFRGYTLSLIVAQPADADALLASALDAGATSLKPATKTMWGYGGVVQAPDGAIWKVATQAKKDTAPPSRAVENVVLLLGVDDVGASKRFYVDHGFTVAKSLLRTYAEFEAGSTPIKLALYKRRAAAKDAGVAPEGSGSHRLVVGSDAGAFTDPDGFTWEPTRVAATA